MYRQEMEKSETGSLVLVSRESLRKTPLRRVFELKLNKENKLAFQELKEDPE